jgi:hypothetical protein
MRLRGWYPGSWSTCGLLLFGLFSGVACSHSGSNQRVPSNECKSSTLEHKTENQERPCGLPVGLQQPEWPEELPSTLNLERDPAPVGATTVVLLPDTQYYASCRHAHLKNQSNWIVRERAARQILAGISLGDLTDNNSEDQWAFVRASLSPLMSGFPLMLTTGNHDLGGGGTANSRESLLTEYFSESWASSSGALQTVMTPGNIENAFYSLDAGRFRLGVLMLEWSPRQATVQWANEILLRNADHRVIVATHAYLYDDSTRYDRVNRANDQLWSPFAYATARGEFLADGIHDGEMLWNALIRRHPGIFMVVSGHVLGQGTGRLSSRGDAGNTVHQVLVNYQMLREGGLGYLRFFEILPDGQTLHMKTYSPSLGLYSYSSEQDFRLRVYPPLFETPESQPLAAMR